jgi:CheY-like chemotaxis protein
MEAIGVMAGGIAHDFNNILTPVMGYTEMALNRPGLDAKVCDYLKEISAAGQRASELVQQILTFSRQTEQIKQPVQVDSIIKESLKLLRAAIPSTIIIRKRILGRGTQILADASQIHQVVMNLCTNAFHAMREKGGVLEVVLDAVTLEAPLVLLESTLPAGDYLRLRVTDSGRGMDEATQKKIFLPFFTTKQVGEGTGLGLSIVHGIVVGMGGSIHVESEVGRGTTFIVYFPSVHPVPTEASTVDLLTPRGSERLLIVDDESVIGAMLQDALTFAGYEVETYESPVRALERVRREPEHFDLLITDLVMPELTGMDLAKVIWELRADLPIILLTGYTETLDEESAREMGFAKMLRKPVPISTIGQTVRTVLDRKSRSSRSE